MHRLIRPSIIVCLTLLTFAFFYGIIALPFATTRIDELKPILYGHNGDDPQEIYVHVETKGGYTIYAYWAYWADTRKEEYEPYAVVYGPDGNIYAFITRVHWQWQVRYANITQENNRAVVYFLYYFHTPLNTYPILSGTHKIYYYPTVSSWEPEDTDWWNLAGLTNIPSEATKNAVLYSALTAVISSVILYNKEIRKLVKK